MSTGAASPSNGITTEIASWYRERHERVLQLVEDLSDQQLIWQPHPEASSIAFNLWHLARWADRLQEVLPGMTKALSERLGSSHQVWQEEGLAAAWGLDATTLGYLETGMEMPNEVAARLRLPNKEMLLAYARRAFAAAQQAVNAVDDEQFQVHDQNLCGLRRDPSAPPLTVGHVVMTWLVHDSEHLGMIEYLRGLQDLYAHSDR